MALPIGRVHAMHRRYLRSASDRSNARPPQSDLMLVTGATRSGKSRFAIHLAKTFGRRIVYLATCQADDAEITQRIAKHRAGRPSGWKTIEHPDDPAQTLQQLAGHIDGLIIDCLTLYVSGLLVKQCSEAEIRRRVTALCESANRVDYPVVLVTNEVGWGIVPEFPLGRQFRDLAGLANQIAARLADRVYLMVAGLPMVLKGGSDGITAT